MRLVHVLLLVIVAMRYFVTYTETLRTTYTRQPMLGQRCHLDSPENLTTLLNIARAQCVWNCLSRDNCHVVSHEHHLNLCELSPQFCDKVLPHENFTINAYGIERSQCLKWVAPAQYDSQTAVEFLRQIGSTKVLAVGRIQDNTGLYPGKYLNTSLTVAYAANASTFVISGNGCEALLVDPGCMWTWIMYTAGNELPVGAVAGGHYRNDVLYVARCTFGIKYAIGYYRPSSQIGYFAHYAAVRNNSDFEILVIMWHCNDENTQKTCVAIRILLQY